MPVEIDLKQISELIAVVTDTDITELTIEHGDQKITLKKGGNVQPATQMIFAEPHALAAHAAPPQKNNVMSFEPKAEVRAEARAAEPASAPVAVNNADLISVTSPMVGTFYRAGSPTAKPFVDIGDRISIGQTVCIIEAMKLMNDMPSEVAGRIVKVCVDNGSTVEYGQNLFLIDPKG
jgi:acetyl-CoA carboxylase biotin carboxyl carrier protein